MQAAMAQGQPDTDNPMLVLVPFDRDLAALSPETFVQQVLVEQLDARRIAVGENFRFGAGRLGSAADLQRLASAHGVEVEVVPMFSDAAGRMSSSRIRRALAGGDLAEARRLLQRPYRFRGQVVRGRGLGRGLGWPTANLQVDGRKFLPQEGVYAAWAWQAAGPAMAAVMNLGPQPTVDPTAPSAVEVHLLDRELELVGSELVVEPTALLRGQQFAGANVKVRQAPEQARAKTDTNHRAAPAPVPLVVDLQATKQRFVTGKEFCQGVKKKAFAKAARTRQKVITPLID